MEDKYTHVEIKATSLDVIDYNNAAILFYEKIGFTCMEVKTNYYYLFGKYYSSFYMVKYYNDADRPYEWKDYFPFSLFLS